MSYTNQVIAICLPMLAAVWLVQRIKISRFKAGLNKPHNTWLRVAAFMIVLVGTALTWHRIVGGHSWFDTHLDSYIDGLLVGVVSGIGTPFIWAMFITVLYQNHPGIAEILQVRYPDIEGDHEEEGQIVTVLGMSGIKKSDS